ncbi:MAG: helix-turn-helix transcriptional regulator [Bacteroidaceae bacterium]|nr:helix-turn-helix transcriptional regulator [Bacteroidaceae bacterium]
MYTHRSNVLHEITPIMESNIVYIVDRHNKVFDFPIHTHEVFELNFLEHASGARRIVGDSVEVIDDMDLVLIANSDLEHIWEKHEYNGHNAREVTIQFDIHFEEDSFFVASPFKSIREMMLKARRGLCFSKEAIAKVYHLIDGIGGMNESFYALSTLMTLLYELSKTENSRTLASKNYVKDSVLEDNERLEGIKKYIVANYRKEITLPEIAKVFNMSISSFGRFFKQQTGRTLSEYVIYLRLNYATSQLIESTSSISDICMASGFNNMSHFNRLFKRNKGCSPSQFRETYRVRQSFDDGFPVKRF